MMKYYVASQKDSADEYLMTWKVVYILYIVKWKKQITKFNISGVFFLEIKRWCVCMCACVCLQIRESNGAYFSVVG